MSHITRIETTLTDMNAIAAALGEVFPNRSVEVHDQAVAVHNYYGNIQGHANVVVRHTMGSADVGFLRGPDGTFSATYDNMMGEEWLDKVKQLSARNVALAKAKQNHHQVVTNERQRNGDILLELEV